MIRGEIMHEAMVDAPASKVWEAYRGLQLPLLIDQLMPHLLGRVQVLEGDGSPGTIILLTFPPGTPGIGYVKEVFTIMDDEKRVKETEQIEGGYLDMGFHSFGFRLEIIDKDPIKKTSSIIRSIIKYEVADDSNANLISQVSISPLIALAQVVGHHILNNNNI
ncbi:Norbelladine synthase [Linum perenne]